MLDNQGVVVDVQGRRSFEDDLNAVAGAPRARVPTRTDTNDGVLITLRRVHDDPREDALAVAMLAQESEGQKELVESTALPADMKRPPETREALVQAGVVFGEPYKDDSVFLRATVPAGWKKVPSSHSMWSDLVDAEGRKRAAIFYKASFHDRSAHMVALTRFTIEVEYLDTGARPATGRAHVVDVFYGEKRVVHSTNWQSDRVVVLPNGVECREYENARGMAEEWLRDRYPSWRDPRAYWDPPSKDV